MTNEGKYIYCVINSSSDQVFGELGIGGRGDKLYTVCFKDIVAVVSNSPIINYPATKVNLLSHTKAIEEVMKEFTVLPARFSTIAEDDEEIKKILEKEYDRIKSMLTNLEGKKELGLKAVFISNEIYKDILKKHYKIKIFKEKLEHTKQYNNLLEIGEMVEKALEEEKEFYKEEILKTLSPLAVDICINKTFGELMILNTAFLVEKNKETEFAQKIKELDSNYSGKIKFSYVDSMPPFNFAKLIIFTRAKNVFT